MALLMSRKLDFHTQRTFAGDLGPLSKFLVGADIPPLHSRNEYVRDPQHWNMKVPQGTDILVTHAAPVGFPTMLRCVEVDD